MHTIDELKTLMQWLNEGHACALATVIATWGSAPRPVGSLLAVRGDGMFEGSVSAGCVENAVIEEALAAIRDGKTRDLSFGVSNETAFWVGFTCGGTIRIHIDPATSVEVLKQALALQACRRPFTRRFDLDRPGWTIDLGHAEESSNHLDAIQFQHAITPAPRLIIFGAVHIAQYLSAMAAIADYEVIVVDPREAYATKERFGETRFLNAWPDEALAELAPDYRTAIVLLTHDPKLDDPALIGAVATPAFYIAALGSRRNHAARMQRLIEAGCDSEDLQRIHGPAGLAIGALSPAEIAISIMAELTAARRGQQVEPGQRLVNARAG